MRHPRTRARGRPRARERGRGSRGRARRPQRRGGEEGAKAHLEQPKTERTGQATRNQEKGRAEEARGEAAETAGSAKTSRLSQESRTNPRPETPGPRKQRQGEREDPRFCAPGTDVRVEPTPGVPCPMGGHMTELCGGELPAQSVFMKGDSPNQRSGPAEANCPEVRRGGPAIL